MGLAPYFARNVTAASQALNNFRDESFKARLEEVSVGISFGKEGATNTEGKWLLETIVRLVSRLYPRISIRASESDSLAADLESLAHAINPNIEITREATHAILVGNGAPAFNGATYFVGSHGWSGAVSSMGPIQVGDSRNPFGALASACLASAQIFQAIFLKNESGIEPKADFEFSTFDGSTRPSNDPEISQTVMKQDVVLVGVGAIGNATALALSKLDLTGRLHVVDPEVIELSNMQRYIFAEMTDIGRAKVQMIKERFSNSTQIIPHQMPWSEFVSSSGYNWPLVLTGLDTAKDRRAVQASLPQWIANAWTQPGDLGVSTHDFLGMGACLYCLYLPTNVVKSRDAIIADALGIPDKLMKVRELLYYGAGTPKDLLVAIAQGLKVPVKNLEPFEGRPLADLYVEGLCGGAAIPFGTSDLNKQDVHVPLSFQSSLAGVLLAATFVKNKVLGLSDPVSQITRVNLLRPLGENLTQPILKDSEPRCICQDPDYIAAYKAKYGLSTAV